MLGRRDNPVPERFAIGPWLQAFVEELCERRQLAPGQITYSVEPPDIRAQMDPSQLSQVLWNLCENALRYSTGEPLLELCCGLKPMSEIQARPHSGLGLRPKTNPVRDRHGRSLGDFRSVGFANDEKAGACSSCQYFLILE